MSKPSPRTRRDLIEDVLAVSGALMSHGVGWFDGEVTRESIEASLPGWVSGDLGSHDARRAVTGTFWKAEDVLLGKPVRCRAASFAAKIALVVSDMRHGRLDRVRPWEGQPVARALGIAFTTPSEFAGEDVDGWTPSVDGGLVEFAHPWRPTPVRTGELLGTATAHVCLEGVDPVDAPISCSLWTPEGRLEVRRSGRGWLRPVLRPGSWRPITVAGFREAARTGAAWRDNPFLARTGHCCPTFDLGDYAEPRAMTEGDELRQTDGRNVCLDRAGTLYDVAGVVHRISDEPLAGIGTVFRDGTESSGPVWVMDDLASSDDMNTLGHLQGPLATWFNGKAIPEDEAAYKRRRGLLRLADWVGLTRTMAVDAPDRRHAPGPWPGDVTELVRLIDGPEEFDVPGCLNAATACAGGLPPAMHGRRGGGEASDDLDALRRTLSTFDARGIMDPSDASALVALRDLSHAVLRRIRTVGVARDDMWAYVACLGVHVAAHALRPPGNEDDFAGLQL